MEINQEATSAPWVPKPTRMPYMNFMQAFRKSYNGPPQKPTDMAKLAAEAWRELSEEEKQPFRAIADAEKAKPRQKDLKRLGTLRPRRLKGNEEKTSAARRPTRPAKGAVAKAIKAFNVKRAALKRKTKSSKRKSPRRRNPRRKTLKRKAPKRSRSYSSDSSEE